MADKKVDQVFEEHKQQETDYIVSKIKKQLERYTKDNLYTNFDELIFPKIVEELTFIIEKQKLIDDIIQGEYYNNKQYENDDTQMFNQIIQSLMVTKTQEELQNLINSFFTNKKYFYTNVAFENLRKSNSQQKKILNKKFDVLVELFKTCNFGFTKEEDQLKKLPSELLLQNQLRKMSLYFKISSYIIINVLIFICCSVFFLEEYLTDNYTTSNELFLFAVVGMSMSCTFLCLIILYHTILTKTSDRLAIHQLFNFKVSTFNIIYILECFYLLVLSIWLIIETWGKTFAYTILSCVVCTMSIILIIKNIVLPIVFKPRTINLAQYPKEKTEEEESLIPFNDFSYSDSDEAR